MQSTDDASSPDERAQTIGAVRGSRSIRSRWMLRFPVAVAAFTATTAAALALYGAAAHPDFVSDFDQSLYAARALLQGENPYRLIGPGRAFELSWPYLYPLPAALVATPFATLSVGWARATFTGLGLGCFAFLLLRRSPHCWPAFLSYPALGSVQLIQWAPWLAVATLAPWVGFFIAAKPNVGIAVLAAQRDRRGFVVVLLGAAVLVLLSLLVAPAWPRDWWAAMGSAPHIRPLVSRPGGFLLLLAALRWRRPEARALLAYALTPMTPGVYEALLFASVAPTRQVALILAILSYAALPIGLRSGHAPTFVAAAEQFSTALIAFVYVPILVVLLRGPNSSQGASTNHDPGRPLRGKL